MNLLLNLSRAISVQSQNQLTLYTRHSISMSFPSVKRYWYGKVGESRKHIEVTQITFLKMLLVTLCYKITFVQQLIY